MLVLVHGVGFNYGMNSNFLAFIVEVIFLYKVMSKNGQTADCPRKLLKGTKGNNFLRLKRIERFRRDNRASCARFVRCTVAAGFHVFLPLTYLKYFPSMSSAAKDALGEGIWLAVVEGLLVGFYASVLLPVCTKWFAVGGGRAERNAHCKSSTENNEETLYVVIWKDIIVHLVISRDMQLVIWRARTCVRSWDKLPIPFQITCRHLILLYEVDNDGVQFNPILDDRILIGANWFADCPRFAFGRGIMFSLSGYEERVHSGGSGGCSILANVSVSCRGPSCRKRETVCVWARSSGEDGLLKVSPRHITVFLRD